MTGPSRRRVLQAAAITAAAGAGALGGAGTQAGPAAADAGGYLVGAGKGDMTGAVAGQGMMGYSDMEQVAEGLLQRIWARAYVIADAATGDRVLFVNADIACVFTSHHVRLLAELRKRYGALYNEHNVNINATHNHNSCGGTSWDYAYVLAAQGHRRNSFDAELAGLLDAVDEAHRSLGPGTVELGFAELHNASANRSQPAFDRNPAPDRAHFPGRIDPQVTALRLRRGGTTVGEIVWFATHGTSLTDANFLIGPDNKGYAAYLAEQRDPAVVTAHAQTNAGDMTPNLWLRKMNPGGPTADHRANRIQIGQRQDRAGRSALAGARPVQGGIASATKYLNMADIHIDGHYTPHGKAARTAPAMMGLASAATSMEDNTRSQLAILQEGMRNELTVALGAADLPSPEPWMLYAQAPKAELFPLGILPPRPWIEQTLPIQLIRIGDLVLAGLPAEITVVSGLRIRRIVADALKVPLENVLLQAYSNGFSQYVTTPEEYAAQQYEGGATLFGRWTLCAYMQEFDKLARALARGRRGPVGPRPADRRDEPHPDLLGSPPADTPLPGKRYGQVVSRVPAKARPGSTVTVGFCGAHPANRVRRGWKTKGYYAIEKHTATGWQVAFDDDHESTELRWERPGGSGSSSKVTVTWRIPPGAAGRYRIRYYGDAKAPSGKLTAISGNSGPIEVG